MLRRAPLVALGLVAPLAGCGGGVAGVESTVKKEIDERADAPRPPSGLTGLQQPGKLPEVDEVDCPGDAETKAGSRFMCTTKDSEGKANGRVYVRMLDDGKFKWELEEGAPQPVIKKGFEKRATPPYRLVEKVALADPTARRLCKRPHTDPGVYARSLRKEEITARTLFLSCGKNPQPFVTYRVYTSERELAKGEFSPNFSGPEDTRFRNGPVYVGFTSSGLSKKLKDGQGVGQLPRELSRACRCGRPAKSSVR